MKPDIQIKHEKTPKPLKFNPTILKSLTLMVFLFLLISCTNSVQSDLQAVPNSGNQLASEPFKIGAVLPLTGSNAFYGEFTKYGFDLAVEDLNNAGGINGRNVTVIYEDSGGDKGKATTAAQKLIEVDQVKGLLTTTTPMAGAIAPVAEAHKIPFIYGSATNSFTENKTYVFKDYPDASDVCALLMTQAIKDGHTKVALFGTNAEFTLLCKKGSEQAGSIALFETYYPGETDYHTQLAKVKHSGATAVILVQFSNDCKNTYKILRELDMHPQMYIAFNGFGCGSKENTIQNPDLLTNAFGGDVAVDEDSLDPAFVAFKKRLSERGWTTQIIGSAIEYDSLMQMANANTGCNDSLCVTNNLRNLNNYQGVSGAISYHGNQIVTRAIMLVHYSNGKWKRVEN